jgi:hypothetical protein
MEDGHPSRSDNAPASMLERGTRDGILRFSDTLLYQGLRSVDVEVWMYQSSTFWC